MSAIPPALCFLLLIFAGWVNRKQQKVIDYLLEENRVLREQLVGRRLCLNDDQRRRLAAKGRVLGRALLHKLAGIKQQPTGAWMMQVGRNLTDVVDGFLLAKGYLIMDRDPLFTNAFCKLLQESGVKAVRLPAKSPWFEGITIRCAQPRPSC